jgi:hypothetical protein
MPAQPVKLYPIRDRYLDTSTGYHRNVPHVEHTTETKGEAEELIATGAFTDNPNHPERDKKPETPAESKE